jgi:hypothetical protein
MLGKALVFLLLAGTAFGGLIPIAGYDVTRTPTSGYGNWHHNYTGTITVLPVTIGGSPLADYSGGGGGAGGTINDGSYGTSADDTHLFDMGIASDGFPANPTVRLYLPGSYVIDEIRIYGGHFSGNSIPGTLTGATVTFDSFFDVFTTIDFGPPVDSDLADDRIVIAGSALAGVPTTAITLSDWHGGWGGYFSIGEIEVDGHDGDHGGVPEPSTWALCGLGLLWLGASRRRRSSTA